MRRRSHQAGFAMLLVFAMAAAVAILLYTELPRVAFEAQRAREQLLIDRGEQYQRAIQLYFRKTRQFPANLDQLENTNRFRFLRHRYKDPITGKDEWRLIHIGPGGMLTDSVTQKPPGLKKDEKEEKAEATGEAKPGSEMPSAATRRRASEMAGPGLPGSVPPGGPTEPGAQPGQEGQSAQLALYPPAAPGQPPAVPQYGGYPPQTPASEPNPEPQVGQPYVVPGQPGSLPTGYPSYQPGQNVPAPVPGVQPGQPYPVVQPGQGYPVMQPGQPYPVTQPGQPYPVVQPGQSYPIVQPGQPYPVIQPGQTYPGMPPTLPQTYPLGQPSPAPGTVRIYPGAPGQAPPAFIQGLLTPGRPGAYPGGVTQQQPPTIYQPGGGVPPQYPQTAQPPSTGTPSNPALQMIQKLLTTPRPGGLGQAQGQQTFTYGAGIAGVASKSEADSIMLYNDRSRYNEWEFIYDLRKDRTMIGPVGPGGGPAGTLLQNPASPTTTPTLPTSPTGPGGRGR